MRLTPENLIRIAKETAMKQALSEPNLVAAYLTGSLRSGDPLLGGAADIDVVFVHDSPPPVRREIIPLTPEIHLDILHNPRSDYEKPKALRVHPWLGPELYDPLPLVGTQHFFEFIQAGVRDKYNEPENVVQRSRSLAEEARRQWNGLLLSSAGGPEWLLGYLHCLYNAANAVALLAGSPLSERRLLVDFPASAERAELPDLIPALFHLCGAGRCDAAALKSLLPDWENAFVAAGSSAQVDKRVVTARLRYYQLPFESILAGDSPQSILWPLLLTWSLSVSVLTPTWMEHWTLRLRHTRTGWRLSGRKGGRAGSFPRFRRGDTRKTLS